MGLLLVGSFFFWLLIVVELILLFACIYNDAIIQAVISVAVFLALVFLLTPLELSVIVLYWKQILGLTGLYVVCGIPWGIFRWYQFVRKELKRYQAYKDSRCSGIVDDLNSIENKRKWNDHLKRYYTGDVIPQISKHKDAWFGWVIFWPVSILVYIASDLIKDIYEYIFNLCKNALQAISNSVFKDVINDLKD